MASQRRAIQSLVSGATNWERFLSFSSFVRISHSCRRTINLAERYEWSAHVRTAEHLTHATRACCDMSCDVVARRMA